MNWVQNVCKKYQQKSLAFTPADNACEGVRQYMDSIWTVYGQYMDRRIARRRSGSMGFNIIWASTRETLTLLLANNKDTDQPAHTRSLISTLVIRYLKSILTRSDIS